MRQWMSKQLAQRVCNVWTRMGSGRKPIFELLEMYLIADARGFTTIRDEIGFLIKVARIRDKIWGEQS